MTDFSQDELSQFEFRIAGYNHAYESAGDVIVLEGVKLAANNSQGDPILVAIIPQFYLYTKTFKDVFLSYKTVSTPRVARENGKPTQEQTSWVKFLYLLLRDHITFGAMEKLVRDAITDEKVLFSDGLSDYAKKLVKRLNED